MRETERYDMKHLKRIRVVRTVCVRVCDLVVQSKSQSKIRQKLNIRSLTHANVHCMYCIYHARSKKISNCVYRQDTRTYIQTLNTILLCKVHKVTFAQNILPNIMSAFYAFNVNVFAYANVWCCTSTPEPKVYTKK